MIEFWKSRVQVAGENDDWRTLMPDEPLQTDESDQVACHLQAIGMGGMKCRAAAATHSSKTDEVTREMCLNCEVGKVYREVGCDVITAKILILPTMGGGLRDVRNMFCSIRKRDVDLEYCRQCGLVVAETTRQNISTAIGLFQAQGFYSAYKNIEEARLALRDGNYDRVITQSTGCLESVMRCVHEKAEKPLPNHRDITSLWKSTRELLDFDRMEPTGSAVQLMNALSGVVSCFGGLRNSLGDAHGKGIALTETSENVAELSINVSATISTMIVRRFNQVES